MKEGFTLDTPNCCNNLNMILLHGQRIISCDACKDSVRVFDNKIPLF